MGATSGIGLKVAECLAASGVKVGVAGRNVAVLQGLKEKYPQAVEYEAIDVTSSDAAELLRGLIDRIGGMDCYLHISGVGFDNEALDPIKECLTIDTNVAGFAELVGFAYRYFRDECGGRGHIAAVTSVAGTNGLGRLAAYSASKCFNQCYLRALNQLAVTQKQHIAITDIRPGWVRTPLLLDSESYPMTMQADCVARRIIKAVRLRKRVCVIDWRWNIVVGLWRLIPNWLWVKLPISVGSLVSPVKSEK